MLENPVIKWYDNNVCLCTSLWTEADNTLKELFEKITQLVIIKNVPCHKCKQCGEVSFSGETVARIEEIIETLKAALTEVAIVEYAA